MAHRNAKLTPAGRRLLVARVLDEGWPLRAVCDAQGISRQTAAKWVKRFRESGATGLHDRSSRPRCPARQLQAATEQRILQARAQLNLGPARLAWLVQVPRSTVHRVLQRHGVSQLRALDRPTGMPIRYERCHPGGLLHLDTKKLARIPDGGGHRVLGRGVNPRRGAGYDALHVAIDDHSRVAYVAVMPDESGQSAAHFLADALACFARLGVRIEQVMTDNAKAYTDSRAFAAVLRDAGARHQRIRPYRPQTNGKAERFIKTLVYEWAYVRPYRTNADRLRVLDRYVDDYNLRRPHSALANRTPMQALVNNVLGHHS